MTRIFLVLTLIEVSCVLCCQKTVNEPKRAETPIVVAQSTPSPTVTSTRQTNDDVIREEKRRNDVLPIDNVIVEETANKNCLKEDLGSVLSDLSHSLQNNIYGQHLATRTIITSLKSHLSNPSPSKALLLSFHGSSGTGKTKTTKLIANALFSEGVESPFYHIFLGSSLSSSSESSEKTKASLSSQIRSSVKRCARSVFVFDEVDSMPPQILDVMLPFVEYHDSVDGVDFRKATFILMSNHGGREINDLVIEHTDRGEAREDIQLHMFEKSITRVVFNKPGGLQRSPVIEKGLVDLFIPFLPLEKIHVSQCIRDYLKSSGRQSEASDQKTINKILDSLQYFKEIYSSTGCKKVPVRSDLVLDETDENDEL